MPSLTPHAPMTYVCAAPGTGKSSVLAALVAAAEGEVVIDIDELLEDGALIGVPIATAAASPIWPAYDRMWRRITTIIRRAGHPVIMLTQVPDADDIKRAAADPGMGWLGWDCSDEVRVDRLTRRGWSAAQIEDALADAAECRRLLPELLTTDDLQSVDEVASSILERTRQGWVDRRKPGFAGDRTEFDVRGYSGVTGVASATKMNAS